MSDEKPEVAERVTVGLIQKTAAELALLAERPGMTRVNVINRAITLYAFVQTELDRDQEIVVRDRSTGATRTVHLS